MGSCSSSNEEKPPADREVSERPQEPTAASEPEPPSRQVSLPLQPPSAAETGEGSEGDGDEACPEQPPDADRDGSPDRLRVVATAVGASRRMRWQAAASAWRRPEVARVDLMRARRPDVLWLLKAPRSDGTWAAAAVENSSSDMQVTASLRFKDCVMEPATKDAAALGVRQPELLDDGGQVFQITAFPGQVVPVAAALPPSSWRGGYSVSYEYGPVADRQFIQALTASVAAKLEDDWDVMRDVCRAQGLDARRMPAYVDLDFSRETVRRVADAVLLRPVDAGFIDVTFPPVQQSICAADAEARGRLLCWQRPSDYLPADSAPALFVRGHDAAAITPDDIDQGALGDCWFLAAVAACAEFPEDLVVPLFKPQPERDRAAEHNMYHVRLAKNGWWEWHVLDGYLPCHPVPNPDGPCFAHNKSQREELWVALLEKAYARVHGCYDNIAGGDPAVALSDLTGYPSESFDWSLASEDLYRMVKAHDVDQHLMFVCSPGVDATDYGGGVEVDEEQRRRARRYSQLGLVAGHAYTLIRAEEWDDGSGSRRWLVQLRNPWGTGKEWTGEFSDSDPVWTSHSDASRRLRALCGSKQAEDGTWWMSVDDMKMHFGGGGACFTNVGWSDIRFRTRLAEGGEEWGTDGPRPVHVVELCPSVTTDALAWAVQTDRRGLPQDRRQHYAAIRVEAITLQDGSDVTYDRVAVSNSGTFFFAHASVAFGDTRSRYFRLTAGRKYYVYIRPHPEVVAGKEYLARKGSGGELGSMVLGVMTRDPCNMRVLSVTPAMTRSFGYQHSWGFSAAGAQEVGRNRDFLVQLNGGNEMSGAEVPWHDMSSCPFGRQRSVDLT